MTSSSWLAVPDRVLGNQGAWSHLADPADLPPGDSRTVAFAEVALSAGLQRSISGSPGCR